MCMRRVVNVCVVGGGNGVVGVADTNSVELEETPTRRDPSSDDVVEIDLE